MNLNQIFQWAWTPLRENQSGDSEGHSYGQVGLAASSRQCISPCVTSHAEFFGDSCVLTLPHALVLCSVHSWCKRIFSRGWFLFSVKLCAFSLLCSLFLAFWGLVTCFYSDFSSWGHKSHMGNINSASDRYVVLSRDVWCPAGGVIFSPIEHGQRGVHSPCCIHKLGNRLLQPTLYRRLKTGSVPAWGKDLNSNLHLVQAQYHLSRPRV